MTGPQFRRDFTARYGVAEWVAPGIRRVLAENPSKYSAWGTGTYIVGGGARDGGPGGPVAVIDPGPDIDSHHAALDAALDGDSVAAILITHTHADHSPAAERLAERTGAPRYGYGPHPAGADEGAEGEAHGDTRFVPDIVVGDGDLIESSDPTAVWRFEALHTPGHISNHLCFAELTRNVLFSGDHVMGWSTTVVSPPDGDMAAYITNLTRLLERTDTTYLPTHGPLIDDPLPYVRSLIEHRLARNAQILSLLSHGERSVAELVEVMYAGVAAELHAPARRSVLAHLVALEAAGAVHSVGDRGGDGGQIFAIAPTSGHLSS